MKTNTILKSLCSAVLALAFVSHAQAGPGPQQQNYAPVKTMKQAMAIQPGDRIAFSCGSCGITSLTVADKERSYLRGYTCDGCKSKFVLREHGRGQPQGALIYEDQQKRIATLLQKF